MKSLHYIHLYHPSVDSYSLARVPCVCLAVSLPDLWTTVSFVVMICFQEVEIKYNELRQTHSDPATDSEDNNGVFPFSQSLLCYFFLYIYSKSQTPCVIFFRWDSVMKDFLLSRTQVSRYSMMTFFWMNPRPLNTGVAQITEAQCPTSHFRHV